MPEVLKPNITSEVLSVIPDDVIKKFGNSTKAVEFNTTFEHDEFGQMALLINKGKGRFYNIYIHHQGKRVGAFSINLDTKNRWDIFHRKVNPDYQGFGLAGLAFSLVQEIARKSPYGVVVIDPIEDDIMGPDLVQMDVLDFSLKKGFLPETPEIEKTIQSIRDGIGFTFLHDEDSGPKAKPDQLMDNLRLPLVWKQ